MVFSITELRRPGLTILKVIFFFYILNVNILDVVAVTAVNLQHNGKCVFVLTVQQVGLQ